MTAANSAMGFLNCVSVTTSGKIHNLSSFFAQKESQLLPPFEEIN